MPQFIDSPTERSTAVTDVILALLAIGCAAYLWSIGDQDPWKATLWTSAFCLLALAALLGSMAHGFKMSSRTNTLFWQPLNLALGLTVAVFVVGVINDLWGRTAAETSLPVMIVIGIAFFGLTRVVSGGFLVFIVYQGIAMLFAVGAYGWLTIEGSLAGAAFMVAGILITAIAAAVQASEAVAWKFIWQFDHNGVYHLIQMVGLLALAAGLHSALLSGSTGGQ